MTPVTIGGMVAGGLLILTTIAVFWAKKDLPGGGVAVTLLGQSERSPNRLTIESG